MPTAPEMPDRFEKLSLLLALFEKHGVDYVLVGETSEGLRREISSDVDIVVSWEGNRRLSEVFREFRDRKGVELIQVYRHEIGVFGALVVWRNGTAWNRLGPDICSDYFRNGHCFLRCDDLLSGRIRDAATGFWFPRPEMDFCYYLVKKIAKGKVSAPQMRFLVERLRQAGRPEIVERLSRLLGERSASKVLSWIEQEDIDSLSQGLGSLRQTLFHRTRPGIRGRLHAFFHWARRLPFPNGMVACADPQDADLFPAIETAWKAHVVPLFRHGGVIRVSGQGFSWRDMVSILAMKWRSWGILLLPSTSTPQSTIRRLHLISDSVLQTDHNAHLAPTDTIVGFLSSRIAHRLEWLPKGDRLS